MLFRLHFSPGIYGVGKAAVHPPALAILSHRPEKAEKNIAWVGKGIVFDTGGLCIKTKVGYLFTGLGPVVPSIISLMGSLRGHLVKCFTTL